MVLGQEAQGNRWNRWVVLAQGEDEVSSPWTAGSTPSRAFRVVGETFKTTPTYILPAPGCLKEGFASLM